MSRFQDFMYIDESTVSRMLSVVEGGEFDSVNERLTQSSASIDGDGGPERGGQATSSSRSEQERSVRQTPEARFTRLWNAISEDGDEAVIDWPGPSGTLSFVEGQFCKLQGVLSVPQMIAIVAASSELVQIGQMMERFGVSVGSTEMSQLESITAMKDMIKDRFPVVLSLGNAHPRVVLPLDSASSRVRIDAYLGQATVYGRFVQEIPTGGSYPLVNLPGAAHVAQPSRQQRRAAERGRASQQSNNDAEISGPVAVLKVLAIAQ